MEDPVLAAAICKDFVWMLNGVYELYSNRRMGVGTATSSFHLFIKSFFVCAKESSADFKICFAPPSENLPL